MKRIVSLLAVVSVVSSFACAGAEGEAWVPGNASARRAQLQGLETSSGSTSTEPTSCEFCTVIPPAPPVPGAMDLDRWDFAGTPLLPTNSTTRSLYLVAFESPVDASRVYVYGIDVALGRFLFSGTLSKRLVPSLSRRMAIDLSNYQASGAANPKSAGLLEIEGPIPPPPPPNIHDWGVENYGKYAWQKGSFMHGATF
jgi:hypothetical protein